MARGSQECPTDHARPKCVRNPKAGPEIEHLQFTCTRRHGVNRRPSARHQLQDRRQPNQRPTDIDPGLHHVSPDHSRQPTLKRIDQRQCRDDRNRRHLARPQRNRHHNRHRIHAHALRRRPCKQEQPRSQRPQPAPKPPLNQFISCIEIPTEVMRQQHKADHHPPDHISHHQLQESKVRIVGNPRHADDGQRAGLSRHDG